MLRFMVIVTTTLFLFNTANGSQNNQNHICCTHDEWATPLWVKCGDSSCNPSCQEISGGSATPTHGSACSKNNSYTGPCSNSYSYPSSSSADNFPPGEEDY
jgi:hypothetical protein